MGPGRGGEGQGGGRALGCSSILGHSNSNATQPASAGLLEFMRRAAHCGFPQLAYLLSTSNSSRHRRNTFSWLRNKVCVSSGSSTYSASEGEKERTGEGGGGGGRGEGREREEIR